MKTTIAKIKACHQPLATVDMRCKPAALAIAIIILAVGTPCAAQNQDQTRGLHLKKIEEGRPASVAPADPKQPRTYRSTTSTASSSDLLKSASASEAIIGVTL